MTGERKLLLLPKLPGPRPQPQSAADTSRTLCEYCDPSFGPHALLNFSTLPWKLQVLQEVTRWDYKVQSEDFQYITFLLMWA